ncbi:MULTISPECIES: hypothetical protein [Rhizobium]|uniref:Holin n=5 Tax=Rhizobium TaxID=379 RepID=A0A7W9D534_9HYPH|nr:MULTISPECIES: hypothetical protein [Rhizobium]ENN86029.1 hypothetical protein RHSP_82693 [Rhizobium freirei PRF 81]AGB73749.1 hypothetical protein RTCIAT899_PB02600 [Rhizobium tropici CIAT 899]MBB4569956.1 hypothetical protein [Rhizobium leucaenae]MBB5578028.1 hypothetical protein [Rhizobium paranaense]TGE86292.1 hypothetical protein C9417_31930 [Rhizobium sp. SEMIA 4088]
MFNTNAIHNLPNILIAVLAAVTAFLIATGCTQLTTGLLECSQSWISPTYTAAIVAVLGASKTLINVVRDGFGGLIKPQPPVEK